MKLLIVTQYFPPEVGAAQARLLAMSRELMDAGHSVEVVTSLPNYPAGRIFPEYRGMLRKNEVYEGISVRRIWSYASQGVGMGRMWNYLSFLVGAALVMCGCKRPDYIFVEVPPLPLAISAILAARLWRVPVIVNVSDLWPDSAIEMGIIGKGVAARALLALERWTYAHADYVCAVTRGIMDSLESQKQVPASKLLFLPNGVDTAVFGPRVPEAGLRDRLKLYQKNLIVYAGTHSLANGLESILDAAAELSAEPEYHFVLVGSGSAKQSLMERAHALRLDNVSFFDPVPQAEVSALYSIALCGVVSLRDIPIFRSARPAKTLAVMACGKPVLWVCNSHGSIVSEADAGIVVDPADIRGIANAIRALGSNPGLAAYLGQNGRRYVEQHCTWSQVVTNWLGQLEQRGIRTTASM